MRSHPDGHAPPGKIDKKRLRYKKFSFDFFYLSIITKCPQIFIISYINLRMMSYKISKATSNQNLDSKSWAVVVIIFRQNLSPGKGEICIKTLENVLKFYNYL